MAALVLFSCARGGGQAEEPASTTEEPAAGLDAVFTDARHGYRISYPAEWSLVDHSGSGRLIRADISRGRTAGLQVRVQAGSAGALEEFANRYCRGFREEMLSHWGGTMEELERGLRLIGANRGFRVSFHARRRQGDQWLLVNYLVSRGGEVLVFQCGARFEERRHYEDLFERIVASLQFTGPG